MSALSFKLPSGRVLLLTESLDEVELAYVKSPKGTARLEKYADELERRSKLKLRPEDPEYGALLRAHGIEETKEDAR